MDQKSNLRTQIRQKQIQFTDEVWQQKINKNILAILSCHDFNNLGLYLHLAYEPSVAEFFKLPKIFGLPKIIAKELSFSHYALEDQLQTTAFGNQEPYAYQQILPDIILVPGLAFDVAGNRLGYGGGYYDRYLSTCKNKPVKIGVCFQTNLYNIIPTDYHDIKMDYIVTENAIHKLC
jgi:5-formyltetrahydrofolate cyclo-ligase